MVRAIALQKLLGQKERSLGGKFIRVVWFVRSPVEATVS
ncbi:hypothetical protein GXM_10005 [Nostoc sphaeroides CCNUC1]|uniref:Uncharacterized protein n=1 Tax=Nostoc sphaeroides CCNUC1 TaxID=2653204 RepID=A0A5P8WJJ2_9NOSO|nr:hypothetical protein GXM_10005 [Nostoc sphaeroides CCNUC1]